MTQSPIDTTTSSSGSSQPKRSLRQPWALTGAALVCGLSLASACGDDDDPTGVGGSAGRGGSAGAAGAAGSAGAGGAAGSGGSAGNAGSAGAAGAAGAGGAPPVGAVGSISVLNADAADLNTPTTAAIRGTDLWVVNGQLTGLFGGAAAVPPFTAVSIPLAGGDVGDTVITLSTAADFFPEGIAAEDDGTLYVGSLTLGTILRIGATVTAPDAEPFVADTVSERGVVGLTVDEDRDTLWFCDSSPTAPGGALVGVNLDTGVETVRHELPDPVAPGGDAGADAGADAGDAGAVAARTSFCNDVIVVPNGNIFITESTGRVFRILNNSVDEDNSATVWLEHPAISPATPTGFGANGIDFVDNRLVISNGETGELVSVNPGSNNPGPTVEVIALTEAGTAVTLCGPDGLQAVPGTNDLVVVENGFCGSGRERVVRVTLDLD